MPPCSSLQRIERRTIIPLPLEIDDIQEQRKARDIHRILTDLERQGAVTGCGPEEVFLDNRVDSIATGEIVRFTSGTQVFGLDLPAVEVDCNARGFAGFVAVVVVCEIIACDVVAGLEVSNWKRKCELVWMVLLT